MNDTPILVKQENGKETAGSVPEVYFLETNEQIKAISDPIRWHMLNLLTAKPMTGSQLARTLKIPRPRAHYHLKILEKVGLIQFVEERQYNHMIERYFRAVANSFRTDHILARANQPDQTDENTRQADEALHNIIQSMLSLVEVDIANPVVRSRLVKMNFTYQEDVLLSTVQFKTVMTQMRKIVEQFLEFGRQNQITETGEDLLSFRYTLLLTPTSSGDNGNGNQEEK